MSKSDDQLTLDLLLEPNDMQVHMLDKLEISTDDSDFAQFYSDSIQSVSQQIVRLENGAEAIFLKSGSLDTESLHPMLLFIHGGPFTASPYQTFMADR